MSPSGLESPPATTAPPIASRAAFEAALLACVRSLAPTRPAPVDPGTVTADTPLFDSGLIDSLGILNVLCVVERATGGHVPTRMVVMKHFRTVRTIVESFWTQPTTTEARP
ncbi:MAG TPA: phosphopantetheine-binding protein [Tepidisphaeraceae bacterium]|nr:phosphopantetheine-binding protein [Tepidisphaeraceae bacterium]